MELEWGWAAGSSERPSCSMEHPRRKGVGLLFPALRLAERGPKEGAVCPVVLVACQVSSCCGERGISRGKPDIPCIPEHLTAAMVTCGPSLRASFLTLTGGVTGSVCWDCSSARVERWGWGRRETA